MADLKLPAVAAIKPEKLSRNADVDCPRFLVQREPVRVINVQAEVDGGGVTHYGVVGRNRIRAATADELVDIKSIASAAQ
jgi:hypothetical protein